MTTTILRHSNRSHRSRPSRSYCRRAREGYSVLPDVIHNPIKQEPR